MRVTTTMAVLVLTGGLFVASASAQCNPSCEGLCRRDAATCKLNAGLDLKAENNACLSDANDGLMECLSADVEARASCQELCGADLKQCALDARAALKECKDEVRSGFVECKNEVNTLAAELLLECASGKAACIGGCSVPDGGGLS